MSGHTFDFDLFVIGAGSGGVRAARTAAGRWGKRAGVAEVSRLGGTCVMRGCVPKKLLVYASRFGHAFEDAAGYGWTVTGADFDWPKLITNKNRELDRLETVYAGLLDNAGVETIRGRARLADAHTVEIEAEAEGNRGRNRGRNRAAPRDGGNCFNRNGRAAFAARYSGH
ncbi:MAG: FAD-dependent oxidoreductase [Rhodospirillales bacterium]